MTTTPQTAMRGFVLCFVLAFAAAAYGADATVPGDFGSIGAAVLGATDVDGNGAVEIEVMPGTYAENVFIQRSNIALIGSDPATTTIVGVGPADTVRAQNGANVSISGFTVTGDGTANGIKFEDIVGGLIQDNIASANRRGINLNRSTGVLIESNTMSGNLRGGMKLGAAATTTRSG